MLPVLFFLLSTSSLLAQADPLNQFDQFIQVGMKEWQIPGMVTVVVHNNEVVFSKAYGQLDIRSDRKVDQQTMFSMASTTKQMIAVALGILVDDGLVDWEDRVVEHLPNFKLADNYATQTARVKDLLTHNLGIKNTDKIWVWDSLSPPEAMQRYSFAKTEYPLRGGFSYQNMMYIVAGALISKLAKKPWRAFVQKRLLDPLGMQHTAANAQTIQTLNNYVTPHVEDYEDGLIPIPLNFTQQVDAAGAMWSCADDMARYLRFLLNKGVYRGDTLLQAKTIDYIFRPQVMVSPRAYSTWKLIKPNFHSYGLGWFQHDYRGEKLDFHTGSLAGMVAIAAVMHRKNTAVYFFANKGSANLRHAIMYKAMDVFAFNDLEGKDWHRLIFDLYDSSKQRSIQRQKAKDKQQIKDTKPSYSLEKFEGTYQHKMFGTIKVKHIAGKLSFSINDYTFFKLNHWHFNTFRSDKHPEWRYRVFLNFNLNAAGQVDHLSYEGPYIQLDFERE